jgi:hypothetical protein
LDLGEGFPSVEMVSAAAGLLPRQALPGVGAGVLHSTRSGRLHVQEQRTEQLRKQGRSVVEVRAGAVVLRERAAWRDDRTAPPRGEVVAWSRRSRSRMVLALASLDYAPLLDLGTPAMVTFTLPADWQTVAPTGKAYKAHLKSWRKRFTHAYGTHAALALLKLEFQRRGAPHTHAFMVPPTSLALCFCEVCDLGYPKHLGYGTPLRFRDWLSHSWADVVHHPDPAERAKHRAAGTGIDYREGLKARDPKRLAVYFSKHGGAAGGKEYQHEVPAEWQAPGAGPGRFWAVWGLSKVVESVPVADGDFRLMKRTLRRLSQRQAFYGDVTSRYPTSVQRRTQTVRVPRGVNKTTGEVRFRTVTRRREYFGNSTGGGFLLVNDGPALVSALSRLEGLTS